MKHQPKLALALILTGLASVIFFALAQPAVGDPIEWGNLPQYFQSPEWLAALVFATVALLKKHVFKTWTDTIGLAISFGVGAVLGLVGSLIGWSGLQPVPGIVLGLTAAFFASGGFDGLRNLLGKRTAA